MGTISSRRMGAADTIWLNMDQPTNPMVIDAIMWFDDPVDWDRLTDVIHRRLIERFAVFRQLAVPSRLPLAPPSWQDDPDFRIERHLRRATLPSPGDDAQLQAYLQAHFSRPLDRARPLWEIHFVDGYRGGAAVVARLHHAIADGIALVCLLLSLTDEAPDRDPTRRSDSDSDDETVLAGRAVLDRAGPTGSTGILPTALLPGLARVADASTAVTLGAVRLLSTVPGLADARRIRAGVRFSRDSLLVAGKLLLSTDPASPLRGTPGGSKLVAWSEPRPLDGVKRAARLAGGTVNDVIVAAVSAALSRYLQDRGAEPVDLTTMVPVNVRRSDRAVTEDLGNQFALVLLRLPSGSWTPLERLAEAKRRMDEIKGSPEALLTFGLITAIGRTVPRVERALVDFFSDKAFGVTTNVPGPPSRRFMAGTPIAGILGWVPGTGRQSVGVSIFTYDGAVRVGFKVDADVVDAPGDLVQAYEQAIDELLQLIG